MRITVFPAIPVNEIQRLKHPEQNTQVFTNTLFKRLLAMKKGSVAFFVLNAGNYRKIVAESDDVVL
jgi:hypothetical protein